MIVRQTGCKSSPSEKCHVDSPSLSRTAVGSHRFCPRNRRAFEVRHRLDIGTMPQPLHLFSRNNLLLRQERFDCVAYSRYGRGYVRPIAISLWLPLATDAVYGDNHGGQPGERILVFWATDMSRSTNDRTALPHQAVAYRTE